MTTAQIRKNFELSDVFSKFYIKHHRKFAHIPNNATFVIIPMKDDDLIKENLKLLNKMRRKKSVYKVVQGKRDWKIEKI